MDEVAGARDRRSEDALLSFEQSALPQAFADLQGRFTDVNSALTRLLGRPREWLLGREVITVLHPLDDPRLRRDIARIRHGLVSSISGEVIARHADGRPRQLLVDVALLREPDGAPRGVVLVGHDLTAVRPTQERLVRQERLYRALSNRASDVAIVTDAQLQVTFVSPALADMLGHDPLDILCTSALDLVHPTTGRTCATPCPGPSGRYTPAAASSGRAPPPASSGGLS